MKPALFLNYFPVMEITTQQRETTFAEESTTLTSSGKFALF